MKRHLVKTSLVSCFALMAAHAAAQSAEPASDDVTPMVTRALAKPPTKQPVPKSAGKAAVDGAKTRTADAGTRSALPASASTSFTAAGSVIVLADGIVANAAMAQIQPPADGFAYER